MLFSIALINGHSVVTLHVNDVRQLLGVRVRHFGVAKFVVCIAYIFHDWWMKPPWQHPSKTFTTFIEKQNYGRDVLLKPRALLHDRANQLMLLFLKTLCNMYLTMCQTWKEILRVFTLTKTQLWKLATKDNSKIKLTLEHLNVLVHQIWSHGAWLWIDPWFPQKGKKKNPYK